MESIFSQLASELPAPSPNQNFESILKSQNWESQHPSASSTSKILRTLVLAWTKCDSIRVLLLKNGDNVDNWEAMKWDNWKELFLKNGRTRCASTTSLQRASHPDTTKCVVGGRVNTHHVLGGGIFSHHLAVLGGALVDYQHELKGELRPPLTTGSTN